MTENDVDRPPDLRSRAIRRLKKKRDFHAHLLVYAMVNSALVVVWWFTGHSFFWPVFPMVGWGIGVVMNAWEVYSPEDFTEEAIAREVQHLRRN